MFTYLLPLITIGGLHEQGVFRQQAAKTGVLGKAYCILDAQRYDAEREYCDAHGLSFSSFSYWRNKLNKGSRPQPQFYPLTVQVPEEPAPSCTTGSGSLNLLVCDKRFCISIDREFNKQVLQQLILTLEDM